MNPTTNRRRREQVLVVLHPDHCEAFAEKNVSVKIIRAPASFSPEKECLVEDIVEMLLPPFWRRLYFPGFCRASETLQPLLPSTLRRSIATQDLLKLLNQPGEAAA